MLFLFALVLGGGGPHVPLLTVLLEALALLLLVRFAIADAKHVPIDRATIPAIALPVALLVVGAMQLVPLPHASWSGLPGRSLFTTVMQVLGRGDEAWPASLSPQDTRDVLLAMLPPIALFFMTIALDAGGRLAMAKVLVGLACASAVLGVLQLLSGDGSFFPYGLPPFDRTPGLFANFNHQATFLASTFVIAVAAWMERPLPFPAARLAVGLILLLFVIGTLITSSRAGLALLGLAGCAGLLLWAGRARPSWTRRAGQARPWRRFLPFGAAAVVLAAIGLLVEDSYRGQLMAGRFAEAVDDGRFTFWRHSWEAITLYGPVGSGLGTFDLVYQAIEPLREISPTYVNHAHNDYLEMALEAGLAGVLIIALAVAWVAWRTVAAFRRPVGDPGVPLARAGGVVAIMIMLHSLVDYPLRTEAMGCVFAFACALLASPPASAERIRTRKRVALSHRLPHAEPVA